MVDPDGRYDASNGGAVDGLHWVVDNEPIALEQLKDRYYEPRLLAKILEFDAERLRRVQVFGDPGLFPAVKVSAGEDATWRIELKDQGGGIGPVLVKIDGKEITGDARQLAENKQRTPANGLLVLDLDLRGDKRLQAGAEIEVQAFNEQQYLRSRGVRSVYQPEGAEQNSKPRIWGVVAGVADYRGSAIDLRYADKDAEDFAQADHSGCHRIRARDRVRTTSYPRPIDSTIAAK